MRVKRNKRKIKLVINILVCVVFFSILAIAYALKFAESKSIEIDINHIIIVSIRIVIGVIITIGSLFIYLKIRNRRLLKTVTQSYRGNNTERDLVLTLLKHRIPAQTIFHDLYLKKSNGNFSQIDLVVATKVGIIVFEVKKYSGWIFGNGNSQKWTQVLAYGRKKYYFYNPIMQNCRHIVELRKQLKQFENIPFYSVIVFYGECKFKDVSFIPEGTFIVKAKRVLDVIKIIMKNNDVANYSNKHEVVSLLKEAVQNGENIETQISHINNIKNMLGEDRIFD